MYGSNLTYTKINWCIGLTVHETNVTVHALFMGPTTTLFRKKIKNGSHSTIHTFKNYFATVFFSFNFQFSAVSKRTLNGIISKQFNN